MKLGLVLEGGASRAYFTSGVLDALLEENIIADYLIGTSAGIANGVSYASQQKGRNLRLATEYLHDKRYMGLRHLVNPKNRSYYNLDFAFSDIPNKHLPFDYQAFRDFKGNVVASVTNIMTGQPEYLEMPKDDKDFMVLRATCALPFLFPIIKIGDKKYMDGGITAPIPVDQAVSSGCDKNIVILTRERGYQKKPEKGLVWASRFYCRYPRFAQALLERTEKYNSNLRLIEELEKEGKVFVIAPINIDGLKRTESAPEKLANIHQQGHRVFRSILPELRNYLEN